MNRTKIPSFSHYSLFCDKLKKKKARFSKGNFIYKGLIKMQQTAKIPYSNTHCNEYRLGFWSIRHVIKDKIVKHPNSVFFVTIIQTFQWTECIAPFPKPKNIMSIQNVHCINNTSSLLLFVQCIAQHHQSIKIVNTLWNERYTQQEWDISINYFQCTDDFWWLWLCLGTFSCQFVVVCSIHRTGVVFLLPKSFSKSLKYT